MARQQNPEYAHRQKIDILLGNANETKGKNTTRDGFPAENKSVIIKQRVRGGFGESGFRKNTLFCSFFLLFSRDKSMFRST